MRRLVLALLTLLATPLLMGGGVPAPPRQLDLSDADAAELDAISAYLNGIGTLKGGFIQIDVECVSVEEQDSAKGLVLSGSGDFLAGCEVSKVLPDLHGTHFARMTFVVKENEVFDPGDVSIFGSGGVVFDAQGIPVDIE